MLGSLGFQAYYIIPLLASQVVITTYWSIKNKSSLPTISTLFLIVITTTTLHYIKPEVVPILIALNISIPVLQCADGVALSSDNYGLRQSLENGLLLANNNAGYCNTKVKELLKSRREGFRDGFSVDILAGNINELAIRRDDLKIQMDAKDYYYKNLCDIGHKSTADRIYKPGVNTIHCETLNKATEAINDPSQCP